MFLILGGATYLVPFDDPQKRHQFAKKSDSGTPQDLDLASLPRRFRTLGVAQVSRNLLQTSGQSGALSL